MIDLFLKAENEAAMKVALPFFCDENGDWIMFSHDHVLEFVTVPPQAFYVNLRCTAEVAGQVPDNIKIYPQTPSVIWL